MNELRWSIKSTRQLAKFPAKDQRFVYSKAQALKAFPDCPNVKALQNHQCQYRLRIGVYRVLFDFDGTVRIVSIEEVKKRDENTY